MFLLSARRAPGKHLVPCLPCVHVVTFDHVLAASFDQGPIPLLSRGCMWRTSRKVGFILLLSELYAATVRGESSSCQSNAVDDASLLSLQRRLGARSSLSSSVASAELGTTASYKYGKFEASIQYGGADGVVSTFFLWKKGSERSDVFWNELGFKKLGTTCDGTCKMQVDLVDGLPGPDDHEQLVDLSKVNICNEFHVYAFEWTPTEVRYMVDGVEVHKITGAQLQKFNENAENGMGFHFHLWPGDESFGGRFSDSNLPIYQYIDWVRYSSYSGLGHFSKEWQEDFSSSSLPSGWFAGSWNSPLGYSRHRPENVLSTEGYAVLALTRTDDFPTADAVPLPPRSPNGNPFHAGISMEAPSPNTIASAELATGNSYKYGKFEASVQYAGASGVISTFFLWKQSSENINVSWNEVDFEKAGSQCGGTCKMQLNFIGGLPGPEGYEKYVDLSNLDICNEFHTYAFEWTPTEVRYTVDGVEMQKIVGSRLEDFNNDVGDGMEFHFNLWPGDKNFGGHFSQSSLPVYQYVDWVRYSSYSGPGNFTKEWQEDFDGSSRPRYWYTGTWASPLGYSAHRPENVLFTEGYAVLALTKSDHFPNAASLPLPPCRLLPTREAPSPSTVASAELGTTASYKYGKFEASIQYGGADGVVSTFFLWKKGSERSDVFWNELGFKKLGAACNGTCKMQVELVDGLPGPDRHVQTLDASKLDVCSEFHTYAYEWTPTELRYTIDGVEVKKVTGSELGKFNDNVGEGMGVHFHLWPGNMSIGGRFSSRSLPVYQYIDWVRYSSYSGPGSFIEQWLEDFNGSSLPNGWFTGNWNSPLGYSAHRPDNVLVAEGYAVVALTSADSVPASDSIPLPPCGLLSSGEAPSSNTVASAELASVNAFKYGKFEASIRYSGANGVVSSFFLWKKNSEKSDVFWNELSFKKIGTACDGTCKMQVELVDGLPGPDRHVQTLDASKLDVCSEFHTYAYEWTPTELRYTIDGVEVGNITGTQLQKFNENVADGMGLHFHLWPGANTFGGHFSQDSLPVYQYIDWVRYSSYSRPGHFTKEWQEDFTGDSMPANWFAGSWNSPLGFSAHRPENVVFAGGHAILALTRTEDVPTAASIPSV